MANTATITAKIGPAVQETSVVYQNVTRLDYNLAGLSLGIYQGSIVSYIDLSGVTTITTSVSGTTFTVTIS